MNRREFLEALGGGMAAAATIPFLQIPAPPPQSQALMPAAMSDRSTGISIRFIQQYDMVADKVMQRLDWFYDLPAIAPPLSHVVAP